MTTPPPLPRVYTSQDLPRLRTWHAQVQSSVSSTLKRTLALPALGRWKAVDVALAGAAPILALALTPPAGIPEAAVPSLVNVAGHHVAAAAFSALYQEAMASGRCSDEWLLEKAPMLVFRRPMWREAWEAALTRLGVVAVPPVAPLDSPEVESTEVGHAYAVVQLLAQHPVVELAQEWRVTPEWIRPWCLTSLDEGIAWLANSGPDGLALTGAVRRKAAKDGPLLPLVEVRKALLCWRPGEPSPRVLQEAARACLKAAGVKPLAAPSPRA